MRSLALMYHRINTLKPDPWTTCVSPGHFAEHLQVIRSLPIPLTVTFDDGYADNFENALPLLEQYDVPATVFVISGVIDSPFEMWWDELERACLAATPATWDWDDPDPDEGATRYRESFARYRRKPFDIFAIRPSARPGRRMMTASEVSALAAGGLVTIGAHTDTHPVLANLSHPQQVTEIGVSKAKLQEIAGREVTLFAYPNGYPGDYTDNTIRFVRDAGFAQAYAAWEGVIDAHVDPFQIPRIMVRDWDGDAFSAVLQKRLSL